MNILIVEDHPIFRFGVRQLLLQRWPQAEIREVDSLAQALAACRTHRYDLALVDLNLPDADGVESVSRLHRAAPDARMLVLSLNAESAYATRVLQLGASGYLAKDRAGDELIYAIERVMAGGRYISAALAEQLADRLTGGETRLPHETLSAQEYRVMLQLAAGHEGTEIAAGMHISPKTVSTYRGRILEKLGLANNAELVRYCIAHHLVPPD